MVETTTNIITEIYTYTDSIGSEAYNLALSERRAVAMKNRLVQSGIDADSIRLFPVGEGEPIADNDTESGQAINRRGMFLFRSATASE